MSGIEPGRPGIEEREAHLIWVGTRILTEHGDEWTVEDLAFKPDGTIALLLGQRVTGYKGRVGTRRSYLLAHPQNTIRCRVEKEDR